MKVHELKTLPKFFTQVKAGIKTFECRKNDRDFRDGDYLLLKECDNGYTGEEVLCKITYVLHDYQFKGIADKYCILSIKINP